MTYTVLCASEAMNTLSVGDMPFKPSVGLYRAANVVNEDPFIARPTTTCRPLLVFVKPASL